MRVCLYLPFLLLASCVGPDYERPHFPVPSTWKNHSLPYSNQQSVDTTWWHHFHDPQLEYLIKEASKNNLDYLTMLARIREARATLSGIEANFFPTVSAVGSGTKLFYGSKVPINPASFASSASSSATSVGASSFRENLYMAGFDATWELDLFGAIRRGQESALAILDSVADNARLTLLSLFAEIAQYYINLRNYQNQLEITQEIITLWQANLSLALDLEKAGLNSQMNTESAKSALDQALATLPSIEANIKTAIHHLGVVLGKEPTALYSQLLVKGKIPYTTERVIAGLPFDLIYRRPDIRMNERLLASATAQIGVSIAALFPQFQLTGNYNYEQTKLGRVFTPGSQFWTYGLNFSIPIFDFGKIQSQINQKYAQKDESLLTYQKSILTALEDVENGLINYASESNRYNQLQKQVKAQEQTYQFTVSRYKTGLNSYLDVIQTKITFLNTKLIAIQSQAKVSLNLVALYKALGGGWETFDPIDDDSPQASMFDASQNTD